MFTVNETSDLQARIHSYLNSFTKAEKKVAEFVLQKTEDLMYLSITELAEKADVGETSVLRFCRKLGFKGYQDFKLSVAKESMNPVSEIDGEISENDAIEVTMQKITRNNINVIQETMSLLDPASLEKAVNAVWHADKVHFYGVGTSGITALDAKSKFMRIGFPVDAIADSHFQSMAAATLSDKDVAIGITVSGSTKDTIDSLKMARENGAYTIALTHYARSPITKLADVVLLTSGKESPLQGGSLASKIAQLHVIDMLFMGIFLKQKDHAMYYREKTAKAVLNKIY